MSLTRWLFIGKTLLGYEEEDVWVMTPRRIMLLYNEYKEEFGYRDRVFVALHQFFGISIPDPDNAVPKDVD